MSVEVTVVIPAYRRTEDLRAAVLSVFDQDLPKDRYELVVVDSSPDESNARMLAAIQAEAPCPMRWFRKPAEGPGPSRNLGSREARGPIVAFMDSDCRAAPGWLAAGLAAFDAGVGIVQGRTLPDPSARLGVFRYYVKVERESAIYETANVFYRKQALDGAGGFPADLTPNSDVPMGGEDIVVAWTVKRNGWRTAFSAAALVYHAVVPLPVWNWIFIKRLFIWPAMLRRFPELRSCMFGSYFLDRAQAFFVLGVLATAAVPFTRWAALWFWVPYAMSRAFEPSSSLRGPFRAVRVGAYLLRDVASFCLLLAGSVKYRRLLL